MAASSSSALPGSTDEEDAKALLLAMERYHPIVRAAFISHTHAHTSRVPMEPETWTKNVRQIPDAVTEYYMGLSGYQCTDPRVTRIASLAAHKFVADLTNDALRICKARQQGKGRLVLMTCLLYTSPSPRDGLLSRMPSSA